MGWGTGLYLLGAVALLWVMYRTLSSKPGWLSKANVQNSLQTLGLLALALTGFVTLLVLTGVSH